MDANWLRGRVLLRAIVGGGTDVALGRGYADAVKVLERLRRPETLARAALLRAGLASSRGAHEEARRRVRAALEGFDASRTVAMSHGCRHVLESLASPGGEASRERPALSELMRLGVRDVGAWARAEFIAFDGLFFGSPSHSPQ
jgi:hypothetical protein